MTLRNYVCWREDCLRSAIHPDALLTEDAYFLATHSPMTVRRADPVSGQALRANLTESTLRDELLQKPDGVLSAVLGSSGMGKSQLVRWLALNCPETATRKVIVVRKHGTTLRGVITEILKRCVGPAFDELRRRLSEAADGLPTIEAARERFAAELSLAVGAHGPHGDQVPDGREGRSHSDMLRFLPALLDDHAYRTWFLREEGAADVLAQHIISHSRYERRDREILFHPEEFLIPDKRHHELYSRMGAEAKQWYESLSSARRGEERRQQTAEWVNANRDYVCSRMLGMSGGDLVTLLVQLRRQIAKDGGELVLFFEDFARQEGIQRELLDAFVMPREEDMCPLRVVIAVTTGYYGSALPDTFRTRVELAVNVDRDMQRMGETDLSAFAARYLSAVRLSPEALSAWHEGVIAQNADASEAPPNTCEHCEHRADCHRTFDESHDVGLYPFSARSLVTLSRRTSEEGFNPRLLLRDGILALLEDGEALRDGRFPSKAPPPRPDGDVITPRELAEIERFAASDGMGQDRVRQYQQLVEIWGDPAVPGTPTTEAYAAFGLPPLPDGIRRPTVAVAVDAGGVTGSPTSTAARPQVATSRPADTSPPPEEPWMAEIRRWGTDANARVGEKAVMAVRELLYDAIVAAIDWDSEFLLRPYFTETWGFTRPSIGLSRQVRQSGKGLQLTLPLPGWTDASTAEAILAAARCSGRVAEGDPRQASDYVQYAELVRACGEHLLQCLRQQFSLSPNSEWDPLETAIFVLAIACCLNGEAPNTSAQVDDWLVPTLRMGSVATGLRAADLGGYWGRICEGLARQLREVRQTLHALTGCHKGGSTNARLLDAAAVRVRLAGTLKRPDLPSTPDAVPLPLRPLGQAMDVLSSLLEPAIRERTEKLEQWAARWREELGDERDARVLAEAARTAWGAAQAQGVAVVAHLDGQADALSKAPLRSALSQIEELPAASTLIERLSILMSREIVEAERATDAFAQAVDTFVKASMGRLRSEVEYLRRGPDDTPPPEALTALLAEVCALLRPLAEAKETAADEFASGSAKDVGVSTQATVEVSMSDAPVGVCGGVECSASLGDAAALRCWLSPQRPTPDGLLPRCLEVRCGAESLCRLRQTSTGGDLRRTRRDELLRQSQELQKVTAVTSLLRGNQITVDRAPALAAKALAGLQELLDRVAAEPSQWNEATGKAVTTAFGLCDRAILKAHEQAGMAWERFTGERAAEALSRRVADILEVFRQLPDSEKQVLRVRQHVELIRARAAAPPHSNEDLEAFEKALDEFRKAFAALEGIPDSVMGFVLGAIRLSGAPLSALSSEVTDWLHKHGLEGSFCVRVRAR